MDSGYITALAALGGAAVGGLTSFATSWTTCAHNESAAKCQQQSKRQKLYKAFIDGAAKTYGDALIHDELKTTGLMTCMRLQPNADRVISTGY